MSMRWILLVLMILCWNGCGEATVRPFVESVDAGVDAGDDEDGGIDDDGGDDDDDLDEDSGIDDDGGIDDDLDDDGGIDDG